MSCIPMDDNDRKKLDDLAKKWDDIADKLDNTKTVMTANVHRLFANELKAVLTKIDNTK